MSDKNFREMPEGIGKKQQAPALHCRYCNPYTWNAEYRTIWDAEIYECENCGHTWTGKPPASDIKRVKEIENDLNKNKDNHLK